MDIVRPPSGPTTTGATDTPFGLDPASRLPAGLSPSGKTALTPHHSEPGKGPSQGWTPFLDVAAFRYLEDSAWQFAPYTSHISRWLAYETDGNYFLLVKFRGNTRRGGGESRTYAYSYTSAEALGAIDTALRRSPHPYSSVLKPRVIDTGVPYA
jgi:hypothetical protein